MPPAYIWTMPARLSLAILTLMWCMACHVPPCRAAGPFQDLHATWVDSLPEELSVDGIPSKEPQRLVAAVLAVALGPFAAHRLYLGTDVKVPIIYGLTFGGFGILVLIDLGHILFAKDLQPYRHNDKVFMWAKERAPTPP